jgi:hypothetical protein
MGKSEQELQTLLNITARFVSKWNLKFNSKKSMVMVIGQKIDKLKRWDPLEIAKGNHTAQPCAIEGCIIEVHNESPNEIRLNNSIRPKFVSYNIKNYLGDWK